MTLTPRSKLKGTKNRVICWLMWWFWESHNQWPAKVTWVFSFKGYITNRGQSLFVEEYSFWRTLWRATGMVFVWAKQAWDWAEEKLWPPPPPPSIRDMAM